MQDDWAVVNTKYFYELISALQSLVNCLPQSELEIMRGCVGNTNISVIEHWVSNAKNILAEVEEVKGN